MREQPEALYYQDNQNLKQKAKTMKIMNGDFFTELKKKAVEAPRKRANFNLHKSLEDDIHKLFVAAEPETYIRPHRHSRKDAAELLIILKGTADVLIFENDGTLKERIAISESGETKAIEIDENVFHGFIPHAGGSVILEVKKGPYVPTPENDFVSWAPAVGSEKVPEFLALMKKLKPGEKIKA